MQYGDNDIVTRKMSHSYESLWQSRANMLKLPSSILNKLVCVQCGAYLSSAPIMVAKSGEQICGECFEVAPDDKKVEYTRQIGLEAVGLVLIFPCRYNLQGCRHTFSWNCAKEHEADCRYSDCTLPVDKMINRNQINRQSYLLNNFGDLDEYTFESDDLKMTVKLQNVQELDGSKLKMQLDIEGNRGSSLALSPISANNPTRLKVETLVSLSDNPNRNYFVVEALPKENIYSTIAVYSSKCNQCDRIIFEEIYHCLFGHPTCQNCRGFCCKICSRTIGGESRSPCKNFARGCSTLFTSDELRRHQVDCEYNDFQCAINNCRFLSALPYLINHCKQEHPNDIILSKTITMKFKGKDKSLYFCCHGKLFECKYFVFDDFVEFVVKYVGSHEGASAYTYTTTVDGELFVESKTKRSRCLGWNETALETAIRYQVKPENYEDFINFNAEISILQSNS